MVEMVQMIIPSKKKTFFSWYQDGGLIYLVKLKI